MLIKNNTLVIYKGKGAVVTEVNSDKYLIRTAAGDSKSVRLKDITFLHAGPCQSVPQPAPMIEFAIQEENAELLGVGKGQCPEIDAGIFQNSAGL